MASADSTYLWVSFAAFVIVFLVVTLVLVVLNMVRLRRVERRLKEIPSGLDLVRVVLERLGGNRPYEGGVHGTCYRCPFASEPLTPTGVPCEPDDPTEAHFRCHLPGRGEPVEWGKYAACTEQEWLTVALSALKAYTEAVA